jgi:hypothetical protein
MPTQILMVADAGPTQNSVLLRLRRLLMAKGFWRVQAPADDADAKIALLLEELTSASPAVAS